MDDNIIKLPGPKKKTRKQLTDVLVDKLTDYENHTSLGHVPFTCPACYHKSSFDFTGVIFKDLTFYCSDCGHGYKVTNPMFSDKPTKKTK